MNWKRSRQRYARKIDLYAGEPLGRTAAEAAEKDPRIAWLYSCIQELPSVVV
jgi:hypothetical protein